MCVIAAKRQFTHTIIYIYRERKSMVSAKILEKTSFFRIFARNTIIFVVKCYVFSYKSSRTTRFSVFTARFRAKHIISAAITADFSRSWQRNCPRLLFAPAAVLIFHEIRPTPYVLRAAAQVATILFFTKILI